MTAESPAPRGTGYRPELDGIRGIAVLLVVLAHAQAPGFRGGGAVGVTLFFVLSGYLITGLLLAERARTGGINLRAFYVRRIRRLAPALIALLAATGVLMAVLGRFGEYPAQAFVTLAYGANLALGSGAPLGFLDHAWSLALEEQFYLLWPLLVMVGLRARILGILAVLGLLAVVGLRLVADPVYPTTTLPWFRADAILAGCALAVWDRRVSFGWLAAAALALTVALPEVGLLVATVASVGLVASASTLGWLRARWLVRVGQISYGLYLWHLAPVFLAVPHGPIATIGAVGLSFVLAWASERWIERPWRVQGLKRGHATGPTENEGPPHVVLASHSPAAVLIDR